MQKERGLLNQIRLSKELNLSLLPPAVVNWDLSHALIIGLGFTLRMNSNKSLIFDLIEIRAGGWIGQLIAHYKL